MPHPSFYSDPLYKQKQAQLAKANWQLGKYDLLIKPKEVRKCKNYFCKNSFIVKPYDPKNFAIEVAL